MNSKKVYFGLAADPIHHGHIILIEKAREYGTLIVGLLTDKAIANGYDVIGLTATGPEEVKTITTKYGLGYDYYFCDETALKTIIRSNPGILKLKKGTIIQKKHWNDVDEIELPKVERPKKEEIIAYFINDSIATKSQMDSLDPNTIDKMGSGLRPPPRLQAFRFVYIIYMYIYIYGTCEI